MKENIDDITDSYTDAVIIGLWRQGNDAYEISNILNIHISAVKLIIIQRGLLNYGTKTK